MAKQRKLTKGSMRQVQDWCNRLAKRTGLIVEVIGEIGGGGLAPDRVEVAVRTPTGVDLVQFGLSWYNGTWTVGSAWHQFGIEAANTAAREGVNG